MGRLRLSALVLILVLLCGLDWQASLAGANAQAEQAEYFKETGHWVTGEFLAMYRSTPAPLLLYGYPITEVYKEAGTGLLVQYFQKARFELHPTEPAGQRVKLSPLGKELYKAGQPFALQANSPGCRTFTKTGFQVCYAFLEFYDTYGGAAQFGEPISNLEWRKDRMVQNFENARLEWQPSLTDGVNIAPANLGSEYFTDRHEDPAWLLPDEGDTGIEGGRIEGMLRLKSRAYPLKAVTGQRGEQTLYIVVQDQRLLPVEGVQVSLEVELPSGQLSRYIVRPLTNKQGVVSYTFPFDSPTIGMVQIRVHAWSDNLETETTTSFRIWW
jgi:hypothetical protein